MIASRLRIPECGNTFSAKPDGSPGLSSRLYCVGDLSVYRLYYGFAAESRLGKGYGRL